MTKALKVSAQLYPGEAVLPQHLPPSSGFTEPGSTFMAPGNYHFRDSQEAHQKCPYFPSRGTAELLLAQYWERVHPVARVLHKLTFEEKWRIFWENHEAGKEVEKSLSALVFTTLFSGLVSLPDDVVWSQLKYDKRALMEEMRAGTDSALARSNWIHSTKVEMLQAVVIYLVTIYLFCHLCYP